VSAWAADQRLVLGQLAVGTKSNEIVAVPKLLELLSLRRTIVTASLSSDIGWLQDSHAWPGLQALGKIEARREIDGRTPHLLMNKIGAADLRNRLHNQHPNPSSAVLQGTTVSPQRADWAVTQFR